jgi:asparagine synthase (glutamine-hydrolysing)
MCGICGQASLDGVSGRDPAALTAMNDALVHRGPDSDGMLLDGPVGLAMRRLSIIDLAGGDQPISNEDGSVHVVQNGEIYNYRELMEGLRERGHTFSTRSDTEVLVHLYEERGPRFVDELRGMFAVALWDSARRRLVLARDRFGIKPLYYAQAAGVLSWASELKALMRQPELPGEVDLDALEAFLAFNSIPAPLTIYRHARKLPPGHVLVWEGGDPRVERYARPGPPPSAEMRGGSEDELAAELRDRLRDSVRAHLVADVPVGVLLSGGIDSSALAALASQESGERVKTFSIGFEERSFNELDQARLVAERYGTDHHELVVRPDAAALLHELAIYFDEPFADSSALPTYLVSKLASEHVKVALSGEGGDELFGGYFTYVADMIAPWVGRPAAAMRPLVERLPSSSRRTSLDYMAKRFARAAHLPPLERHHGWKEIFSGDARAELLGSRRAPHPADPLGAYRARYAETASSEPLARLQDVDIGIYLPDDLLTKTDRASMAHSLETRVPFLDTALADFALSLPRHMRVRGLQKKRLLRKAVEPLVPREIARGRKRGFSIPAAAWLRGELEPFAREVLSPDAVRRQGFFEPDAVTRVLDRHVSGREDLSRQLWGLMSFALWHERHARVAVT